jgi:hypothetical protein
MAVVNLTPEDGLRIFAAGTIASQLHVYNARGANPARYVIQIGEHGDPEEHAIAVGHTDTYNVNGQWVAIRNYGPSPSLLQLLYVDNITALEEVSQAGSVKLNGHFDRARRRSS